MKEIAVDREHTQSVEAQALAIEFRAVSKSFGQTQALQGIDLAVRQGQVVALLGPNGAGKTTAISLMLGLRRPTHGQVRLLGREPRDRRVRSRCGIMLQESGVPLNLTTRECIALFRSYYPHPLALDRVIEMAGLQKKATASIGSLSGGQRQRLYFALAICGNPDLLFLDEPTAGLDVEARHAFWEQIRLFVQQGKTILLTTHYLEEADALAERIIVIDQGRIRADASPIELKARFAHKRVSFQISAPLAPEIFARLPVEQLELGERSVSLYTPQLEVVLRAIFAQPIEVSNLEISGAALEDAFFSLLHNQQDQQRG